MVLMIFNGFVNGFRLASVNQKWLQNGFKVAGTQKWFQNGFKIQKQQTQGGGRETPAPFFLLSLLFLIAFLMILLAGMLFLL